MRKPHLRHPIETVTTRVGSFEYTKTGAARFDLSDPYHLAVILGWPRFFLALFLIDLAINFVFALLYWAQPGSISNAGPSLLEAFFFSIETLATVGYGVMAPATLYGHIISSIEILCGLVFTALVTGLIFVRFSRPRAKFRFADSVVVTRENGKKLLMIRVGNGKLTLLFEAQARITAVLADSSNAGQLRTQELTLERQHLAIFALSWTIMHEINETSPLWGIGSENLAASRLRLIVFLEARDQALGSMVYDMQDYNSDRIRFGMRYQDVISVDGQGRTNIDLTRISLVEPDLLDEQGGVSHA